MVFVQNIEDQAQDHGYHAGKDHAPVNWTFPRFRAIPERPTIKTTEVRTRFLDLL